MFNNTNEYPNYGSDCANFVQQCLKAGCFPMTNEQHSYGTRMINYHDGNPFDESGSKFNQVLIIQQHE